MRMCARTKQHPDKSLLPPIARLSSSTPSALPRPRPSTGRARQRDASPAHQTRHLNEAPHKSLRGQPVIPRGKKTVIELENLTKPREGECWYLEEREKARKEAIDEEEEEEETERMNPQDRSGVAEWMTRTGSTSTSSAKDLLSRRKKNVGAADDVWTELGLDYRPAWAT